MEQQHPFSSEEAAEVRRIAKYTLGGYNLGKLSRQQAVIKQAFDLFLLCSGMEHGDVYSLPYGGGAFDQPYKTMRMWMLFRNELVDHIGKENKKRLQKMQNKTRRR